MFAKGVNCSQPNTNVSQVNGITEYSPPTFSSSYYYYYVYHSPALHGRISSQANILGPRGKRFLPALYPYNLHIQIVHYFEEIGLLVSHKTKCCSMCRESSNVNSGEKRASGLFLVEMINNHHVCAYVIFFKKNFTVQNAELEC